MININVLFEFITSIQLNSKILDKLISDEMIVVGGLRILYDPVNSQQCKEQLLLEDGMEFGEMVELYKRVGVKLVLHQFKVLERFMKNYRKRQDARILKQAVVKQLQA